jgi:hypothetical protein
MPTDTSNLLTPDERAAIDRVRQACGANTADLLLRALSSTRVDLHFSRAAGLRVRNELVEAADEIARLRTAADDAGSR